MSVVSLKKHTWRRLQDLRMTYGLIEKVEAMLCHKASQKIEKHLQKKVQIVKADEKNMIKGVFLHCDCK